MRLGLKKLRRWTFGSLNLVKSRKIRGHYDEIKQVMENPRSEASRELKEKYLTELLAHATRSCDYYLSCKNYGGLHDFPVIDKRTIIENFDKVRSSVFYYSDNFKVFAGDSDGVPFNIFQDQRKRDRQLAETMYFMENTGANPKDKIVYLHPLSVKQDPNNPGANIPQGMPIEIVENTKADMANLLDKLRRDKSGKHLVGSLSCFEHLCKYLDDTHCQPQDYKIRSVISLSEGLDDPLKERLTKYLQAPIYERYSTVENGILAQQSNDSPDVLELNSASYVIEILEESSVQHVVPGATGRIVITDLFNYAMPMIRYDTGLKAQFGITSGGSPVLSKIYGQKMDAIYDSEGNFVSPNIFEKVGDFSNIQQFQFIQKGEKEYSIRLQGLPENTDEKALTAHFRKHLGEEAVIEFEYEREIPHAITTKRIRVLNAYLKKLGKSKPKLPS